MTKPTLKNIIYPGIILALVAITIFLMIRSVAFISRSVNMMFTTDASSASQALKVNTTDYILVAKKLGLPTQQ